MVTIANDFLTVKISRHGAELTSIKDNLTGRERLWQADPAVWGRHAPVLFPIVGALADNQYHYAGKTYHMGQHGFARDRDFTVLSATPFKASFVLKDDDKTRAMYPFAFRLIITFALENNNLHVTYHVDNPDKSEPLFFSIGGHPGFKVPMTPDTQFSDYYLNFKPRKSLVQIPLVAGEGIDYTHRTLAATDANLALTHETFDHDALIFALLGKTTFNLVSDKTKHGVSVTMTDTPYLGVWSPYPTTGDFVCSEPWWGIADTIGSTGDLTRKLGINRLEPGTAFEKGYMISIF